MARRGGVKRISGDLYEEVRRVLKAYVEDIVRCSTAYTEYARKKTDGGRCRECAAQARPHPVRLRVNQSCLDLSHTHRYAFFLRAVVYLSFGFRLPLPHYGSSSLSC
ncbi:histone H4 [Leishmania braziliensis MHOM/BR/75/M2904]|uniref:Histone H4 n=1 Tax=Leishmania braziliensis TaxID=5660 RepID=A4HBJ5_LEIBR|nr:histone H4 [Leishmania braziliensis MHOM/BR/75/M2904]CAM38782.1 histone H4 [Leishmania braziliensis MHOM/BR/75/M2904]